MKYDSFLNYKNYHDFWLERLSVDAQPHFFNDYEIRWAILQTEYKYFGDSELTDTQQAAIDILVWCAQEKLK